MSVDLKTEAIQLQVKEKLNDSKVKLWLPPYYVENNGICIAEIQKLSAAYSTALGIPSDNITAVLLDLQQNAFKRLEERNLYHSTGTATIRVRVPHHGLIPFAIQLSDTCQDLQNLVAYKIDTEPQRIKLIFCGRVLNPNETLSSQEVKNGAQVMAVILENNISQLQAVESSYRLMENTRADAKLLAGKRNNDHEAYLQVEDQAGNTLSLPPEERKALVVAMSLHEKGRAALKRNDYALALVLLLEADKEFSLCNCRLLESVDNYALLNLDIAWCYLSLRSVADIPDAENRLRSCEQSFHKSYGANLERLVAIKGTTGNEAALLMRLHLLQGIVLFHRNKRDQAGMVLREAERELESLRVDDSSLCTLLELGFGAGESRLALRATRGNLGSAVEFITLRHNERSEIEARQAEEKTLKRERRRLGRCEDGKQWVEPKFHKLMTSMGYPDEAARLALQRTNNNMSLAIQLIDEQPSLRLAVPPLRLAGPSLARVPLEVINQVASIGFDPRIAKAALKKHMGNIQKAVEELMNAGGQFGSIEEGFDSSDEEEDEGGSSSSRGRDLAKEMTAYKRLAEDMPTDADDHLDLTLGPEEHFLRQYKVLLEKPEES